jgi:integrase
MAPRIGRLTALFVKKHKTPGRFGDGGNLYLQITNANARSWIFRYGKHHAGLGSAFNVTLEEARDLAYEYRKLLREGVDRSKVQKVAHHAAMPYAEVAAFMTKLRQRHGVAASALEFCVLTAARSGEVLGARRDEFDLGKAEWLVPGERMKGGKPHRVPLSARSLQIIRR